AETLSTLTSSAEVRTQQAADLLGFGIVFQVTAQLHGAIQKVLCQRLSRLTQGLVGLLHRSELLRPRHLASGWVEYLFHRTMAPAFSVSHGGVGRSATPRRFQPFKNLIEPGHPVGDEVGCVLRVLRGRT